MSACPICHASGYCPTHETGRPAVEVVRRGRFSWDVVTRKHGLLMDMSLSMPFMFRRSAVRYARRRHRELLTERTEHTVLRLPLDEEPSR